MMTMSDGMVAKLSTTGHLMPLLGLGTSGSKEDTVESVECALTAGYRHIDTAYWYWNEEQVGEGVRRWVDSTMGGRREEVFVVTKMPAIGMREGGPGKYLKKSLTKLQLPYVDLYLLHTPFGIMPHKDNDDVAAEDEDGYSIVDEATDIISVWKEMEELFDQGLVKNIGVSNYNVKQLKKIIANARIPPAVNQVELSVYLQQPELTRYCQEKGIVITAYAPFGSPGRISGTSEGWVLEDPIVQLIAENLRVSPAQVLLRYFLQQGISVIPKSSNPARIKANMDVRDFTLSSLEVAALKTLDKGEAARKFDFGRVTATNIADHPEYPY